MKVFNSIIGKILGILLCIIIGAVLAVGGEALAVYLLATQQGGVKTVSDLLNQVVPSNELKLELDDEVKKMSVLDWGKSIAAQVTEDTGTIGGLEHLIGTTFLTDKIYELIGIDQVKLRESSIKNIGQTIAENLTLGIIADKFNISLPDLPIFEDDTFLSEPVTTAFANLTEYTLSSFIKLDENSNAIMKKLADLKISELGGEALTNKINEIKISDIIEMGEDTNAVLKSLKDLTIGELGGGAVNDKIGELFIDELITINESSSSTLKAIQFSTSSSQKATIPQASIATTKENLASGYTFVEHNGEVYAYANGEMKPTDETNMEVYKTREYKGVYRPLVGIDDRMKTITIGELIEVDPSNTLLNAIKDSTLDSLPDDINKLFLGELITIDIDTSQTLQALKYATLKTNKTLIKVADVTTIETSGSFEKPGSIYVLSGDKYYVGVINNEGGLSIALNSDNEDCYEVYETKFFDGIYHPLISIDETTKTLLICELMTISDSAANIMKSIKYAALESTVVELDKATFDASTFASDPSLELDEDVGNYIYSDIGVAYICKLDEEGNRITTLGGTKYEAYKTKLYGGKYYPLKGISDIVDDLKLGDALEIDANSARILRTLKDTKLNKVGDAIASLFIDEITTIEASSSTVLKTLRFSTLEDQIERLTYSNTTFEEILTGDRDEMYRYFEYDGTIYAISITEILIDGTEYDFNKTKYYQADDELNEVLRPLVGMNKKLDKLALKDVFSEAQLQSGVLSLVDPETALGDISTVVATAVQESTVSVLQGKGVINNINTSGLNNKETKAYIFNSTLTDMIQGLVNFAGDPFNTLTMQVNYHYISRPTSTISTSSFASLSDFVGAYAQYNTISLQTNVVVNVDTSIDDVSIFYDVDNEQYLIPIANFEANGYTLTINSAGKPVKVAVFKSDLGGYTELSNNQYGYSYYTTSSPSYIPIAYDSEGITIENKNP